MPERAGGAFARQLPAPACVLDVRPPPRPAREPAAVRSTATSASRPAACVLLLSRSCDAELDAVAGLLGRVGVRSVRLDSDQLAALDLLVDPGAGVVRVDGEWLAPTVSWVRHFSARAIGGGGGPACELFLRDSWQAVAGQLTALPGASIRSERPGLLTQLLLAERNQIAVPPTVVTTDPAEAKDVLHSRRLIIKAVHEHFVEAAPGRLSGVFPSVTDRCGLTSGSAPGPPVVVQEYVEHDAELRVYYVAGQLHAFEVSKVTPADPWLAAHRVGARQVDVPPAVAAATRILASAMSVRYGAFDFLIRDEAPVFLELNPDGDWLWIEAKARTTVVTLAVARMLCDLHREGLARLAGTARQGSFDLVAFLSARAAPACWPPARWSPACWP